MGELTSLKYTDQENDTLYIQRTEIRYKNDQGISVYGIREFPKTESSMDGIVLTESSMKVLSMIKKLNMKNDVSSDCLFYEKNYGRLHSSFFNRELKKICNELNIPYRSMHKLRKTYASYLLANGVEEKITQSQLRHKDSVTTHRYYEFSIRNREHKKDVLNRTDILKKCNHNFLGLNV